MTINLGEIIVWTIVGLLAGSMAGAVVTRTKKGFGWPKNLGVGLVGAFLGGIASNIFNISLGLGDLKVTFEDILLAFVGALLCVLALHWLKKRKTSN